MKLFISALLTSIVFISSSAFADHDRYKYKPKHHHHHSHHYEPAPVYARVVSSTPIYREVAVERPYQSCGVETVQYRSANRRDAATGAIVGGVIGAALGREFGGRHDAFMGGVAGAQLGHSIANAGGRTYYEDREVCTTQYRTEYRRELVGYDVAYAYQGRTYYTESPRHPGSSIRVDIRLD